MQSTSTVALTEHETNGDAVLEVRAIGAYLPNRPASPPLACDDQIAHSASMVANSLNTDDDDDDDDDDDTQSDADETGPEAEALEREMGRYVPRTKPSKPAIGAKSSNLPFAQGKATNTVSQPPGTKKGRPLAVTATGGTTAPRPKK